MRTKLNADSSRIAQIPLIKMASPFYKDFASIEILHYVRQETDFPVHSRTAELAIPLAEQLEDEVGFLP